MSQLTQATFINDIEFPAKDQMEIFENGQYILKNFVFIPVQKFFRNYNLTKEEVGMLEPLFEKLDQRTPKNSLPKTSTCRQANWTQDTLKAEHKLFDEVTENTKTSTEEVLMSTTENELPKIINIEPRKNLQNAREY